MINFFIDKTTIPLMRFREMVRQTPIMSFQIKIKSTDYKRFLKSLMKKENLIESITIRKHNTSNNGLYFFILIEFYTEIAYSELFEKHFAVLRDEFEIIKLQGKWGA